RCGGSTSRVRRSDPEGVVPWVVDHPTPTEVRPPVTTPTARRAPRADDPWSPQEEPGVVETVGRHVEDMADRLLELRRVVHQQPELSWHEMRTTALVTEVLTDAGVR